VSYIFTAFSRLATALSPKNDTPLAYYNFNEHKPILIIFGMNVTETAGCQTMIYCPTSPKECFLATWQNTETRKSHPFTQMLYYCFSRV